MIFLSQLFNIVCATIRPQDPKEVEEEQIKCCQISKLLREIWRKRLFPLLYCHCFKCRYFDTMLWNYRTMLLCLNWSFSVNSSKWMTARAAQMSMSRSIAQRHHEPTALDNETDRLAAADGDISAAQYRYISLPTSECQGCVRLAVFLAGVRLVEQRRETNVWRTLCDTNPFIWRRKVLDRDWWVCNL